MRRASGRHRNTDRKSRIMWREESLEELSDGRFYTGNDMVKIGTNDCAGCSDCCRMGPVIVLDPLDVFELNRFLQQSFEEMLNETIELKVIDGLIMPALKLVKARGGEEAMVCPYLGGDGRCTIHEFRPGICRLYPLGRSWENGDFRYILQVNECTHCTGSKMKVKKWLGIPDLASYEEFCRDWHNFLEKVRHLLDSADPEGKMRNQICIYLLQQFFLCDWNVDDFYEVFGQRRREALRKLGFAG